MASRPAEVALNKHPLRREDPPGQRVPPDRARRLHHRATEARRSRPPGPICVHPRSSAVPNGPATPSERGTHQPIQAGKPRMNADERQWHPDQPRSSSTNTPCAVKIPPANAVQPDRARRVHHRATEARKSQPPGPICVHPRSSAVPNGSATPSERGTRQPGQAGKPQMNADERKWHPGQPRSSSTNTPYAVSAPPATPGGPCLRPSHSPGPQPPWLRGESLCSLSSRPSPAASPGDKHPLRRDGPPGQRGPAGQTAKGSPQRHGGRGPPAPFAFIRVHPRFQMGPPPLRSEAPISRARQENRK